MGKKVQNLTETLTAPCWCHVLRQLTQGIVDLNMAALTTTRPLSQNHCYSSGSANFQLKQSDMAKIGNLKL